MVRVRLAALVGVVLGAAVCGPTYPVDGDGCCVGQSGVACEQGACCGYLRCARRTLGTSGLEATYGRNGTCWKSTAALADACEASCKSGVAALKSMYPDAGCL